MSNVELADLEELLLEFVEVMVHQIMYELNIYFRALIVVGCHKFSYVRKVYAVEIFERRSKYGIPVFMSRHPEINEFIGKTLRNARPFLRQGVIKKFIVCSLDSNDQPIEMVDINFQIQSRQSSHTASVLGLIEEELRAVVLKSLLLDTRIPLSATQPSSFTIIVSLVDSFSGSIDVENWIGCDRRIIGANQNADVRKRKLNAPDPDPTSGWSLFPVKSVALEQLELQVHFRRPQESNAFDF